ncbi:phosphoribosyltransferase family protein [Rathayibacter agropyri]|uniref:phosphoribosyltransferase family protein n=1 Tax=Rathayibacter agropyri TaxID=1634927 RepID=UPI001563C292|nr:phosphoribosyltransferase family protein [Rathayibacter agropyri]NRD09335.1 adenine phosphoribosyltransferase [Rathayibacter agropyri]
MTAHTASFDGVSRDLPVVPVSKMVSVAFLKLYGDVELTEHCADQLTARLTSHADVLLAGESGGILLAHGIARRRGLSYVLARKKRRPTMRQPLAVSLTTMGTAGEQMLFIDEADRAKLHGNSVAIVDEVVSSGATVEALRSLADQAGGHVIQVLAIATEGDERSDVDVLTHLPLFPAEGR